MTGIETNGLVLEFKDENARIVSVLHSGYTFIGNLKKHRFR